MVEITRNNIEFIESILCTITDWFDKKGAIDWVSGKVDYDRVYIDSNKKTCYDESIFDVPVSWQDFSDCWDNLNIYAEKIQDMQIDIAFEKIPA